MRSELHRESTTITFKFDQKLDKGFSDRDQFEQMLADIFQQ